MSNQHQELKHVSTEPNPLNSKRERRRGAAGRAAALRRAPSDSDCSVETASLSADSGDRAPRPLPQPTRNANTRSRRRGSEWEVLEGLKDGQRYDKRPDVFNGYLHKKRKWPLKGWHKRFFVVDGGILVYARSPTDVARGRLHGSVDVGLSVISAKARRRRIDIDADEFIYHLRAKTPEVFRTWLNVLKVHRLYRQHLLTFGARESTPKIHAPLEDLIPTDTSSRDSNSTVENFSSTSSCEESPPSQSFLSSQSSIRKIVVPRKSNIIEPITKIKETSKSLFSKKRKGSPLLQVKVTYLNEKCDFNSTASESTTVKGESCSTDRSGSSNLTIEQQMISAELNSLCNNPFEEQSSKSKESPKKPNNSYEQKISPLYLNKKAPPTPAFFFFPRRHQPRKIPIETSMRKSNKSTNLFKYKNVVDEPKLCKHMNKCMLLKNCKSNDVCSPGKQKSGVATVSHAGVETEAARTPNTASEYDRITEKLIVNIFQTQIQTLKTIQSDEDVKRCINQVVRELYDAKVNEKDAHPVKILFRCLLEYWLKNTSVEQFRVAVRRVQSVNTQSIKNFTNDKNLSSLFINSMTAGTQFHGISGAEEEINKFNIDSVDTHLLKANTGKNAKKILGIHKTPRCDNSFVKDKRIQQLEKLLKNTVYICETACSNQNEKDIRMTKVLLQNLEKLSHDTNLNVSPDCRNKSKSNSSADLPEIQETIDHLISEASVSPDVAKEFLNAYLNLLRPNSSRSVNTGSQSTQTSQNSGTDDHSPVCDVQTESVQKKVSKSITTLHQMYSKFIDYSMTSQSDGQCPIDPGQTYLKDFLDKVTTVFNKSNKNCCGWPKLSKCNNECHKSEISIEHIQTTGDNIPTAIATDSRNQLRCVDNHNLDKKHDKAIVINLSNYDLENISMLNDPKEKELMTVTVKLKEKQHNYVANKKLDLKFSDNSLIAKVKENKHSEVKKILEYYPDTLTDNIDLKPYITSSEGTSKAYFCANKNSLDEFNSSNYLRKYPSSPKTTSKLKKDAGQSCYIMSSLIKNFNNQKNNGKKKVRLKEGTGVIIGPTKVTSGNSTKGSEEFNLYDKNLPKVIDDKFILLLLDNLSLLSKNIPHMYKEINNMYEKLRKKHEKMLKSSEANRGVGLLGKIYNAESNITKDAYVQCELLTDYNRNENISNRSNLIDSATSTSRHGLSSPKKSVSIAAIYETADKALETNNSDVKTDQNEILESRVIQTDSLKSFGEFIDLDREISLPNLYTQICTRDCAISSILKTVIDKESDTRSLPLSTEDTALILEECNCVANNPKLAWSETKNKYSCEAQKTTSLTQSDFNVIKIVRKDLRKLKDVDVYQLFLRNHPHTESMSEYSSDIKRKSEEVINLYKRVSEPSYSSGLVSPTSPTLRGPQAGFVSGTPGGRLAGWIIESGGPLESISRDLGQAQLSVQQLQRLLDALELHHQVHHDTDVSIEGASPNVKKDRRKFGLRKKKSNSKCASIELAPPQHTIDPSSSHMALSALTAPPSPGGVASSLHNSAASLPLACAAARPQSLPGAEALGTAGGPASITSLTPDHQLREDFTILAKDLVSSLKSILSTMVCERSRLHAAMDAAESTAAAGVANGAAGGNVVVALRNNLSTALQLNSELRSRLSRIHDASDLTEISSVHNDPTARQFQQSLSYSSSCVSASEFFDAEENEDELKTTEMMPPDEQVIELDGDSSSEGGSLSSEEGSASSDNSDAPLVSSSSVAMGLDEPREPVSLPPTGWSRRAHLPRPRPTPGGPSLWNLLYKNIGKDLSQISMPVTINEPLNMLQRLCEELEYCELLDAAAECRSPIERAALVAAFAVSAYASSAHRAASKPFNPLLAETYECIRGDRGFRFIAEQVSHHPPISACDAESARWRFWQEARIKTKFWGKSMEFQPAGQVHVRLANGDHYSWNKVTTCVHNLFGGQRWVDQYGEMHITCYGTDISCKLNFVKASSWSSSRHEVRGAVVQANTGARLRLQGRWSEALYAGDPPAARCLWRPGAMPPDCEIYYGFTRFAMELNEMEPGMKEVLPPTDTRLRPDQRALEEGDVEAAERHKLALEQAQRERRRDAAHHRPLWFRKSVEDGEEMWVFSGEYWKAREAGFPHHTAPPLW